MVDRQGRWLILRFPAPQRTLSWAILGGGFKTASAVAWRQVFDGELTRDLDPRALLTGALSGEGLTDAVGLLTGCPLDRAVRRAARMDGLTVECVATVGLGNALRAGDRPAPLDHAVGTINLCVWLSKALTDEAFVEAQALATEARTLAMLAAGVPSTVSGLPATGTGTDCQVIAAPAHGDNPVVFVGKHTVAGHLIGSVVGQAIAEGITTWLAG
jgi:adenosylcobinamide amidohydrolase